MLKLSSLLSTFAVAGMLLSAGTAMAAYPEKPVTIITQGGSGSVVDLAARQLAGMLSEELGQPFLVVNATGAGGNIAVNNLLQAPADGYTLCVASSNPFGYNLNTLKVRYKFEDLEPISIMYDSCMAVIAKADCGWKTVKDAFTSVKAQNRPLKLGIMDNLSRDIMVKIGEMEGVKVAPIPQKGGGANLSSVLGGHIDLGVVGSIAVENTKAGKVVTLASTSSKRFKELPDVPTLAEQGYDLRQDIFIMFFGIKGIPEEILEKLSATMVKLKDTEKYQQMLKTLAVDETTMGREFAKKAAADQKAAMDAMFK